MLNRINICKLEGNLFARQRRCEHGKCKNIYLYILKLIWVNCGFTWPWHRIPSLHASHFSTLKLKNSLDYKCPVPVLLTKFLFILFYFRGGTSSVINAGRSRLRRIVFNSYTAIPYAVRCCAICMTWIRNEITETSRSSISAFNLILYTTRALLSFL